MKACQNNVQDDRRLAEGYGAIGRLSKAVTCLQDYAWCAHGRMIASA